MRWIVRLSLPAAVLLAILACGKSDPAKPAAVSGPAASTGGARDVDLGRSGPVKEVDRPRDEGTLTIPALTDEERFTAALERAVDLYAQQKYMEALAAFEEAQKIQRTDSVAREIAKLKSLLDARAGAARAVEDVRLVLEEGQADEAARLATTALEHYGDGDHADDLTRLKQQADAVVTAAADDAKVRLVALKTEIAAAIKGKNLRAAAVALEQALELGEDEALSRQLADVRDTLKTYDDNRRKAAEYRRDAAQADAALTRLQAAQQAWDTPQVRGEIDEVRLIADRRRDRVSVADFEVRGDVGETGAGRSVAEDLLPHFKPRFDPVERAQLTRVLSELKLDAADLTESPASGREVARLAKVRYVVVGSVSPLAGVTVRARLVEAATGLVVQSAKVNAPSLADLDRAPAPGQPSPLKQLALMLTMSDEQRLAYEAALQRAETAVAVKPIEATELRDIPPPPPPPAEKVVAPAPIVTFTPRPQPLGAPVVTLVEEYRRLPVVVAAPPPPPPALGLLLVREQAPRRHALLRLSLELGDNLFRRRRYAEARRHFSLALTLAGPRREIELRLDACRRLAPPPPPIVVAPPPVRPVIVIGQPAPPPVVVVAAPRVRPRLAVFGFVVSCRPQLVPAATGDWIADQLAGYCTSSYELIDRGEVCWYMGRLNITMSDLLRDVVARRCLAQALNARYFVFGAIEETASFNVSTTLMDAESGATAGQGKIHVKDQAEMKLRLGELARQIGASPDEARKIAQQGADSEKALGQARQLLRQNKPAEAAQVLTEARKSNPNSVAVNALLGEAQKKQRLAAAEAEQRKLAAERKLAEVQARKRQQELAQQAAAERVKAAAEAQARGEAERKKQEQQKATAAARLRQQAADATKKGDHTRAVGLLQSAAALRPDRAIDDELGKARAAQRAAADQAAREARDKADKAAQAQREAAARRVLAEKAAREKADAERKKAHDARERALHDGFIEQAKALLAKKDYAGATAAAQSARRHLASDASAKLLREAQDQYALAEAAKKSEQEKKRVEEEQRKRAAEQAAVKKKQGDYAGLLARGKAALDAKKYAEAEALYAAARKLFDTDAARGGETAARRLMAQDKAAADAKAAEAKKAARVKELVALGDTALAAKKYDEAIKRYREATQLDRTNAPALAGLSRAERERGDEALRQKRARQAQEDYKLAMDAGRDAAAKKNYQGAVNAYGLALKYRPNDAAATAALAAAKKALDESKKPKVDPKAEEAKKREAAYAAWMKQGDDALKGRKFAEALKAYDAALQNKPGDQAAVAGKKAAQQALDESKKPKADPKAEEAKKREAAYNAWMKQGDDALKERKFAEALKAYDAALQNKPGDARAVAGKKAAQQALDDMKKPKPDPKAEEAKKREAAYAAWMKQGDDALKGRKFAEALKAYDNALQNKPGDARATAGRKAAQQALDDMKKPKADPKAEEAKKREAAYAAWMKQGEDALKAKKFADAAKAYDNALQNKPGDAKAIAGKKAAVAAQQAAAKPDPAAEHARAMQQAKGLEAQGKHAEAVKAYEAALAHVAGDYTKNAALRTGQFNAYLGVGRCQLAAKKPADAAKAYEEALKRQPTSAEAKAGLARARAQK